MVTRFYSEIVCNFASLAVSLIFVIWCHYVAVSPPANCCIDKGFENWYICPFQWTNQHGVISDNLIQIFSSNHCLKNQISQRSVIRIKIRHLSNDVRCIKWDTKNGPQEQIRNIEHEHLQRAWNNREQNTHQNESPTRDQDRGAQIGIITTRITALLMFRIHCRMLHSPCLHESITLFQSFPLLYKWKWN